VYTTEKKFITGNAFFQFQQFGVYLQPEIYELNGILRTGQ